MEAMLVAWLPSCVLVRTPQTYLVLERRLGWKVAAAAGDNRAGTFTACLRGY